MKDKKRLGLSVLIITAVAAAAIGGSYAYFTAQRTAAANKFSAGTLDMSVTGDNNTANEPFVVDNIGVDGTISGTKTWTIKNTGSMPGRLLVRLNNVVNEENGCNDQEKAVESDCEAEGNEGDMGKTISLNVALDGQDKVSSLLSSDQQEKVGQDWDNMPAVVIPPGQEKTVTFHWNTPRDGYGNEIQSDSVRFDSVFRLVQISNGPTPAGN